VSTRAPYNKHILTVQAIDRDAVGTGIVRYMLVGNGHTRVPASGERQNLFDIHPKFGVISNKVLMRQYAGQTFYVTVNARDEESIADSEDTNTTALVHLFSDRKFYRYYM